MTNRPIFARVPLLAGVALALLLATAPDARAACSDPPGPKVDWSGCNKIDAKLTDADLTGANLTGAKLIDAYLLRANLSGADLRGANLAGAFLLEAKLEGANLKGANLEYADLTDANLTGVIGWDTVKNKDTIIGLDEATGVPD